MIHLDIKPLSVNEAWQGKRFKTPKYKAYQRDVLMLLPHQIEFKPPLRLNLVFGFSSKLNDLDNPIKLFTDCIVKKYGFDDRDIYHLEAKKEIVKKGHEFIRFEIISI